MQERIISVSTSDLAAAVKEWDAEARAQNWRERADEGRFRDSADYLLDKVEARQRRRHAD